MIKEEFESYIKEYIRENMKDYLRELIVENLTISAERDWDCRSTEIKLYWNKDYITSTYISFN